MHHETIPFFTPGRIVAPLAVLFLFFLLFLNSCSGPKAEGIHSPNLQANTETQVSHHPAVHPITAPPQQPAPKWDSLHADQANAGFGERVAAGDVNGDGYPDLIVSAGGYRKNGSRYGAVYLFHGGPAGLNAEPASVLIPDKSGTFFGESVAGAGDLNGDGYDDLVVGAFNYQGNYLQQGAAYVYFGSKTGIRDQALQLGYEDGQEFGKLGTSVAGAGDVNKDGYADIIVGAEDYSHYQESEGLAFLYYGQKTGLNPDPVLLEINKEDVGFGSKLSGLGDINGDGYDDFGICASKFELTAAAEGAIFIYLGQYDGLEAENHKPDDTLLLGRKEAWFGLSFSAAGDLNGDGFDDLLASFSSDIMDPVDEDFVLVYFGSAEGLTSIPPETLRTERNNVFYGNVAGAIRDFNGDGFGEVVVAARAEGPKTDPYTSSLYLYTGTSSGINTTPSQTLTGTFNNFNADEGITSADFNKDGFADLVVGCPKSTVDQEKEGVVYVYYGHK